MLIKFICMLCLLKFVLAQNNTTNFLCPLHLSIDISNGTKINETTISSDSVTFNKDNYFDYNNTIRGCVCNIKKCILKCCAVGQKMDVINSKCIEDNNSSELNFHVQSPNKTVKDFYLLYRPLVCKTDEIPLPYTEEEAYNFTIYENGKLEVIHESVYAEDTFCIEEVIKHPAALVVCRKPDEENHAAYIGMLISLPFLLATFIVFALLPDRNLHMKALMFYVICLSMGHCIFLLLERFHTELAIKECKTLAYLRVFFLISSFFWMNVICLDIWFTFSGLRGLSRNKSSEKRRFYYYFAYACGASLIHTLIVITIDISDTNTEKWYHPNICGEQTFIRGGYPLLLFFHLTMAVLIGTNIILFALTAWKIRHVKKETKMLRKDENKRHSSFEKDKQKFNLYLKLLFLMGINWSMEIISWAVIWKIENAPHWIWILPDFCNAAYGVFIFFIFVFKKKIWILLKKRYYSFTGKPFKAHSIQTSTNTRSTVPSSVNGSMYKMNPRPTSLNLD